MFSALLLICLFPLRHYGSETEAAHVEPARPAAARAQQEHAEGKTTDINETEACLIH